MPNLGVAPVNTTTLVGQVRSFVGDVTFTPDAITPSMGDYLYFSDADLTGFLIAGNQNPLMATGFAYLNLSAQVALQEAKIATDDLKVDNTSRSLRLQAIAEDWFARANNAEWFTLTPTAYEPIDVRDFMYPTGARTLSDIFFELPFFASPSWPYA